MARFPKILAFFAMSALIQVGCGDASLEDPSIKGASAAVVGGRSADWAELYGTVEIRSRRPSYGFCSGTLIAPRLVLTAGHCVVVMKSDGRVVAIQERALEVGAGYLDSDLTDMGQVVAVQKILLHDQYDAEFLESARGADRHGMGSPHDIALLVLKEPLATVTPVPLVSNSIVEEAVRLGDVGLVSGYGVHDLASKASGQLYLAEADLERATQVEILTRPHVGFADSCYGDSGGPLYLSDPDSDALYLAGVVSRGRADVSLECGAGGIYTSVSGHAEWIQTTVQKAFDEGMLDSMDLGPSAGREIEIVRSNPSGCSVGSIENPSSIVWWLMVALVLWRRRA